ncbi:hypothetical protein GCM10009119_23930 [Algoriphagus jejuensis]|uniref:MFS transporter n=1 Tax=Algoriphagus jejuensis TaxID=419934 RepID=A0ABN1N0Q6_9BACT
MELQEIRTVYRSTERLTVLLLLFALPAFAVIYLYQDAGQVDWGLPQLTGGVEWALAGLATMILIVHYMIFQREIKTTLTQSELLEKVKTYCQATRQRFWILFFVSLLATLGLLLSQNPVFTLIFAVTMVFFSLGKPSPDRMARLMKLKKEDRETIREASRPE